MIFRLGKSLSRCTNINRNTLNSILKIEKSSSLADKQNYYFAQSIREKMIKELDEEMQYYRENLPQEDLQNVEYFKKDGWQINYDPKQTLYSFSKSTLKYDIKIFTHVKGNPPNQEAQEQKPFEKQSQDSKKLNYAQLLIWIKKKQGSKWMVSELGILDQAVELTTIHFTAFAPGVGWQKYVYPGPDIQSLPKQVLQAIQSIFQKAGLKTQLLMNMVIYASGKADELDYKWIQNLKQVIS